jgi:hypothetical protein
VDRSDRVPVLHPVVGRKGSFQCRCSIGSARSLPRDYNRWLIPPAALAVHLCIGEIYAFSVFKVPLFLWVVVTVALAYGLYNTVVKVADLFSG